MMPSAGEERSTSIERAGAVGGETRKAVHVRPHEGRHDVARGPREEARRHQHAHGRVQIREGGVAHFLRGIEAREVYQLWAEHDATTKSAVRRSPPKWSTATTPTTSPRKSGRSSQPSSFPPGVRLVPAGEVENASERFSGLGTASLVAAFGVLAVLVLEFRTFKSTAIVASVIPLGVIGGMVALYLSGYTLSFTAVIGFVALMGIEVKNSILLVDFTDQLRADGMMLDAAIQKAREVRFVAILLTSATAIGGLLPLALEGSILYSPLAIVILGGLVSSTILTRVVTPVLYKLLAPEVHHDAHASLSTAAKLSAAE
jgi:hypothetical protein